MLSAVAAVATVAVTMVALDAVWLSGRAALNYRLFASIQGSPLEIQWLPAALCYAVMVAGVWFFAVKPTETPVSAALSGAALGAVVYGTYDLANWATLKRYPSSYALTDWLWGTVLFSAAATAGKAVSTVVY